LQGEVHVIQHDEVGTGLLVVGLAAVADADEGGGDVHGLYLEKGSKSLLFCEQKRSKKNFISSVWRCRCQQGAKRSKSFFGSFFSKKELLTFFTRASSAV
jgi:hypothetical protein